MGESASAPVRPSGMWLRMAGVLLVGRGRRSWGLDEAGGDGVGGDAAGGEFAGEGLGEADEAGFGGGVVGLAGLAVAADDAGDVDDAARSGR